MKLSEKLAALEAEEAGQDAATAADRPASPTKRSRSSKPSATPWDSTKRKVRELVLEEVAPKMQGLSSEELADEVRARRVDRSSVYRTLGLLVELGLARRVEFAEGAARFELAEPFIDHHHHLVCIGCGGVEDVTLPDPLEAEMDRIVKSIGKLTEFSATSHSLEIEGRCARCDG